jgi:hypothetical protein
MTDNPAHPPTDGGGPTAGATVDGTSYDLSMDGVPADWFEAQEQSPIGGGDPRPAKRSGHMSVIPRRHESLFVANVAALAGAFLGGATWYFADRMDLYEGPWAAVGVGILIAAVVRLTSRAQPSYRAAIAVACYLLTLLLVLILITHHDLTQIYGESGSLQAYEDTLIRTRLQNLGHLTAYGLGALLAVVITAAGDDG